MSRVSVIIPVYNASATLEATIRSIVAQTYQPFEVIVVLDGPDDEIIQLFEVAEFPAYVRLVELQNNAGVANARNKGIQASRGDYIALCDADDVWHPQKLEVQLQYALNGYSLIGSQAHRFSNTKELMFQKTNLTTLDSSKRIQRHQLKAFNPFYTSSLLFDRKLITQVEFDCESQQEDYQFLIDVFCGDKVAAVVDKRKLIGYRIVINSRSGSIFYSAMNNFIIRRKNFGLGLALIFTPLYIINVIHKRYFT